MAQQRYWVVLNAFECIEVAMTYEALKMLHNNLGDVIEQHEAKLANLKKSNCV